MRLGSTLWNRLLQTSTLRCSQQRAEVTFIKIPDAEGSYSCPEPCRTSQVERKQISPSLEEHPHHLTKGYYAVEKLSILVT